MDTRPTGNVVVFALRGDNDIPAAAVTRTLRQDCLSRAWDIVRTAHGSAASDVLAIYSEWGPSTGDTAFLHATFPGVAHSFTFPRADADGVRGKEREWTDVLRAAETALSAPDDDVDVEPLRFWATRYRQAGDSEPFPILCSAASASHDAVRGVAPKADLVPGKLFVYLVTPARPPHDPGDMLLLTHPDLGGRPFAAVLATAFDNLRTGMRVEARTATQQDTGLVLERMMTVFRSGGGGSAAVALPGFYEYMCELLGGETLLVGLRCADHVHVTRDDWPMMSALISELVLDAGHPTEQLAPVLLRLSPSGMEVVAERPGPAATDRRCDC